MGQKCDAEGIHVQTAATAKAESDQPTVQTESDNTRISQWYTLRSPVPHLSPLHTQACCPALSRGRGRTPIRVWTTGQVRPLHRALATGGATVTAMRLPLTAPSKEARKLPAQHTRRGHPRNPGAVLKRPTADDPAGYPTAVEDTAGHPDAGPCEPRGELPCHRGDTT